MILGPQTFEDAVICLGGVSSAALMSMGCLSVYLARVLDELFSPRHGTFAATVELRVGRRARESQI